MCCQHQLPTQPFRRSFMNIRELILEAFGPDGFYIVDSDERCLKNGSCRYQHEENGVLTKCAVGRWLISDFAAHLDEACSADGVYSISGIIMRLMHDDLDWKTIFKPEVQDIPERVWTEMQNIHDESSYWDECGITSDGQEAIDTILHRYPEEKDS